MKNTILATGGTGYVGAWVVKGLLEKGHTVRLTVRDKAKKENYRFLSKIAEDSVGSLEVWEADLLKKGSFDKAAKGCDRIVHMASPFRLNVKNAQSDLVDPAVKGTLNVLQAANRSNSVKKVVLTSSIVAVFGDNADQKKLGLTAFTEAHFNNSSTLKHQPYSFSKVQAEKSAWELANQQSDWQLVVMNPAFVMGPSLTQNSQSESLKIMSEILSGKYRSGAPELYLGYVDVRDVAKAHIFGLENETKGRHILSGRVTDMLSFIQLVKEHSHHKNKLPNTFAPKWLLGIVGFYFGITRKFVTNNVGIPIDIDASKSKEKLNLNYLPLEQTVKDMVLQMEAD